MGAVYTAPTITGYNSNPPSDDGSATEANRLNWSKHKTKIGDPIKTTLEQDITNTTTAFGKVAGGITSTATSYQVVSGDQGKTISVTATATITTPDATVVGTPFRFKVLNISTVDITVDGSGSQTIDGAASISVPAGASVDLDTDGSNWFSGQNALRTQITPQGYLTLTSATPVITGDVTAATSVYYALDTGNLVPIPNGTKHIVFAIAELTLTLAAQHLASSIYDVFLFEDPSAAGTIVIGTGPAWTTVTAGAGARGTGAGTTELTRLNGLFVNNVAATMRNGATTYSVGAKSGLYVGSLFMDGTNGQISCHRAFGQSRKWGPWNAYNQKRITLLAGDSTASWTYASATVRPSNNSTANSLSVFVGLRRDVVSVEFAQKQRITVSAAGGESAIGVGWNSTTAYSGLSATSRTDIGAGGLTNDSTPTAKYKLLPTLGLNVATALEGVPSVAAATNTFYGTNANMQLEATWFG